MTIKNPADLYQEILRLEDEERLKRRELVAHIITPAAALHTASGLFKNWLRAGGNHRKSGSNTSLFNWAIGLVLPVISGWALFKNFGYIIKSIDLIISRIFSLFGDRSSFDTIKDFFKSLFDSHQ